MIRLVASTCSHKEYPKPSYPLFARGMHFSLQNDVPSAFNFIASSTAIPLFKVTVSIGRPRYLGLIGCRKTSNFFRCRR